MDEDLSSPEEEEEPEPLPPPKPPAKQATPVQPAKATPTGRKGVGHESDDESEEGDSRPTVMVDEDLSGSEEEEVDDDRSPAILQPTRAPPPVTKATPPAPRPLKSVRDVTLTESEEEEEEVRPVVKRDKELSAPAPKAKSSGLIMTHQTQKPKNSGLLLDFNNSSPSAPVKEKKKSRKSEKPSSHKKKRHKSREGPEEDEKSAPSPSVTAPPSDPFDFNSLDAWLGSDDVSYAS